MLGIYKKNSEDQKEKIEKENKKTIKEVFKEKTEKTLFTGTEKINFEEKYYELYKIINLNNEQKNMTLYCNSNFEKTNLDFLKNENVQFKVETEYVLNTFIEFEDNKYIIFELVRGIYKLDPTLEEDAHLYLGIKINSDQIVIIKKVNKNAKSLIEEEKNKRNFMNILKQGVKFD